MNRASDDTVRRARRRFRALGESAAVPPPASSPFDPGTPVAERPIRGVPPAAIVLIDILERIYGSACAAARSAPPASGAPLRVLRLISNLTQGGVGKVCLQTLIAMDHGQVETTVLVFGEKPKDVAPLAASVPFSLLACPLQLTPAAGAWPLLRATRALSRQIERIRPHVVHVHEPQFAPAARLAAGRAARHGAPARLVVHLHNDYRQRTGSLPAEILPAVRRALGQAALVACSRTIEDAARDWLRPAVVDMTRIEDGADDRRVGSGQDELAAALAEAAGGRTVVACMAHLAPHKRIADFVLACRALLDEGVPIYALLMVYGKREETGRARAWFDRRIAPAEGEMLFRVGQPHALFPKIGLGVSPSSLEGLGLNLLEYQSHGIPVVCTDLPPHREVVEDGATGLLVPVGDVPALTAAIRRVLSDEVLRSRLGEGGRRSAAGRLWSDTADATLSLYRRLVMETP